MSFHGHVENGVVVFDEPISLPDGTAVRIEPIAASNANADWDAAMQAARELECYDFTVMQRQAD